MNDEQLQVVMGLIMNAGNAKSEAVAALAAAKDNDFSEADARMKAANDALVEAHNTQTGLLTAEASGKNTEVTLLMVHSQDHLMNAISYLGLTQELIDVYKRLATIEK
ncbi:PTS lactose/cellobiose transporter subunit IIA [Enterococcus dongliensis]|uniref:PTS lactose/cellobiose transporter subunit IIA n=1 Tax=Enterococcus dongliensis TaxID=2559925 RepID=A0AAW8TIQ4_9ENTE|nr:PTS lactose/cellobiose transporter subunit IIA [Enterococcus dongliensis]MDT2596919.1 PTS lactose/cellobiose transporter subunit IIA [Enterococcus dongliensis]MDT2604525.1 PTS lactose/cellobiose transporter subunit IIA [Enterococcus dongliensis]MDT2634679.1 PTS lactose/cellobiose transporter subunit IIA [Enterococcus dongliensis]MDT2637731.1 PTS lactose/cellobiose transporter subunit IIA [Enterococcus dongliensis]MDT2638598.1 PTS lactose/cellobiose transporter subunit IIA [Enterococcus dong